MDIKNSPFRYAEDGSRMLVDTSGGDTRIGLQVAAEEVRLDRLREELKNLQERRTETMTALAKKRSSRKALERLREQAFGRHVKEMMTEEQKQLDESSQVAFVNRMLQRRRTGRRQ